VRSKGRPEEREKERGRGRKESEGGACEKCED